MKMLGKQCGFKVCPYGIKCCHPRGYTRKHAVRSNKRRENREWKKNSNAPWSNWQ